jgi:hypothetical protein
MFVSMWLAIISYVCKPRKIIPYLFVGATVMRVVGNNEGDGKGGKGNGNGNKGVRRVMTMATKRAVATMTRVAGKEESKGGKADGNKDKVVGDKEGDGKGSKSNGNSISQVTQW